MKIEIRMLAPVAALAFVALVGPSLLAQAAPAKSGSSATPSKKVSKKVYRLVPPPANFSPPQIAIEESSHDWGTVLQGEIVNHAYTVRNTGGAPLRIERVKPSCGCTTVNFTKVIEPGGQGEVTLRVNTQKFSGSVKKSATVYSNASRDGKLLVLQGKIETPLTFEPRIPRIDVVRGVPATPTKITIRRASQRKIVFKGVKIAETKKDLLKAELQEIEAGSLYNLVVTPTLPKDSGTYHYIEVNVQIEVDGKPYDIPVRVSMKVRNRVEATPTSAYFSVRETNRLKEENAAPIVRNIEIKSLDPAHEFHITGVNLEGSHFQTKVETVEEGKKYRLAVSLPQLPTGGARRVSEKVIVTTDDPAVPKLTVRATASFSYRSTSTAVPTRTRVRPSRAVTPTGAPRRLPSVRTPSTTTPRPAGTTAPATTSGSR